MLVLLPVKLKNDPRDFAVGLDGINTVLHGSGGSIIGWVQTFLRITDLGRKLSAIYEANDIPETIMCSRSFLLKDLIPTRSFYMIGNIHGVCSFALGNGFLITCGLMSEGLGWIPSGNQIRPGIPSAVFDRFMTRISFILALHIRKSLLTAQDIFERSKNNEDDFREDVIIPCCILDLNYGRKIALLCQAPRTTEFLRQQYDYWKSQSSVAVIGGYEFDDYMKRLEKESFLVYVNGKWQVTTKALEHISKYHGEPP